MNSLYMFHSTKKKIHTLIYMLPETLQIYSKYSYFLHVLSNERLMLFNKNKHELDYDNFFQHYNWIIWLHWESKPIYRNFKARRYQIIKQFNYEKYMILLKPHFCYDVRTIILGFLF